MSSAAGRTARRAARVVAAVALLAAMAGIGPSLGPVPSGIDSATPGSTTASRSGTATSAVPGGAPTWPLPVPSRAAPSPAAPSPTAPSQTAGEALAVLRQNRLYSLRLRPSCPRQREPADEPAYRGQVLALVACLDQAWSAALAGTGISFSAPSVAFYGESRLTLCGLLGTEYPAMYCPLDATMYFSAEAWRESSYYRLSTAETVLHEYAHHVQHLAGIFDAMLAAPDSIRGLQRRVELQAHCLAMFELANSDLRISQRDRNDLEYQFAWSADTAGHGSASAKTYWGRRGLAAQTAWGCNTWTASATRVR